MISVLSPKKEVELLVAKRVDRDAVTWGFRMFLGRDPENNRVYDLYTRMRHVADFRGQLWTSQEFRIRLDELNAPNPPRLPVDVMLNSRDAVVWGYALLFDREPENEATIVAHLKARTVGELRRSYLKSQEFQSRFKRVVGGVS